MLTGNCACFPFILTFKLGGIVSACSFVTSYKAILNCTCTEYSILPSTILRDDVISSKYCIGI
jgi:hypothetical protein